jgi:ribosomal protein S18 acetylase RimI-like enzyme
VALQAEVEVRPASDGDLSRLTTIDVTYPTGRVLALERHGKSAEMSFSFHWLEREPGEALYADYSVEGFQRGLSRADLFLVALIQDRPVGHLQILVPAFTDAAEITDLAVDKPARRSGVGRALVDSAVRWAKEREFRALWVEPSADNAEAIEFYLSLGFRLSGFNDRMYSNRDHEDGKPTLYMYMELPRAFGSDQVTSDSSEERRQE